MYPISKPRRPTNHSFAFIASFLHLWSVVVSDAFKFQDIQCWFRLNCVPSVVLSSRCAFLLYVNHIARDPIMIQPKMSFAINRFRVAMRCLLLLVESVRGSVCDFDCSLPYVSPERPCHQKVGRRQFEATGVRYIAFLCIFVALLLALNSFKMTTEKV